MIKGERNGAAVDRGEAAKRLCKCRAPQESRGARLPYRTIKYAGMAELADALDSGSSESNFMEVQVLLPAYDPDPLGSDFFMWMFL